MASAARAVWRSRFVALSTTAAHQWRYTARVCHLSTKSSSNVDQPRTADDNDFLSIGRIVPEDDDETAAAKERQRKILTQRLRRSKLADAMRMENEKIHIASADLLAPSQCFKFPPISAEHLFQDGVSFDAPSSLLGRVSLVVLSFNGMGKQQGDVYSAVFAEAFGLIQAQTDTLDANAPPPPQGSPPPPPPSHSSTPPQLVDLHYLDGSAYSMFKWALKPGVRKTVDAVMQPFSYIKFQPYVPHTEAFTNDAEVHNRAMCHVYLVDHTGTVRWKAHQVPQDAELEGMVAATHTLLAQVPASPPSPAAEGGADAPRKLRFEG